VKSLIPLLFRQWASSGGLATVAALTPHGRLAYKHQIQVHRSRGGSAEKHGHQ